MHIPIENIYYLLCYAWNKLEEKERVDISVDNNMQLLDLFTKVLINSTKLLLKRGIDKSYVDYTEELAGIKGKLEFSHSIKSNLIFKQRAICTYDDFSLNIVTNRILVSTIFRLLKTNNLDVGLKRELFNLSKKLVGIDEIELTSSVFKKVRLHRNNRFYGFILNVCQIIYENTLPLEEKGKFQFVDFTRDEAKMNRLFEAFVRNFYRIEQSKFNLVRSENIKWKLSYEDIEHGEYLPQMETDITLENHDDKIIIDTKYYTETMSVYFSNEKIKSSNLYQLFSYLINQEDETIKSRNATGMLLYPTVQKEYDLDFRYNAHKIKIRNIDLNQNWRNISNRLKEIIS